MVQCYVPGCRHYSERDTCRYFQFPNDEKRKEIWIRNIRREDRQPSKSSKVCSCHFKDGLKENAPTIFKRNESIMTPDAVLSLQQPVSSVSPFATNMAKILNEDVYSKLPTVTHRSDNSYNSQDFPEIINGIVDNPTTRLQTSSSDLDSSIPPSVSLDEINLDDFMDIVTSYKCKFCSFTCCWKRGLIHHIENTHITGLSKSSTDNAFNIQLSDESVCIEDASTPLEAMASGLENSLEEPQHDPSLNHDNSLQPENTTQEILSGETTMQEQLIFLCGQCNQAFLLFDECRDHMIKEHSDAIGINKKTKRKPKEKLKSKDVIEQSANDKQDYHHVQTMGKRQVRPPKTLSEDYLLNFRRQKYVKRQQLEGKSQKCEFKRCKQQYKSKDILNYHQQCHIINEQGFKCPECQEQIKQWPLMAMHLWRTHEMDMELYVCEKCSFRTNSAYILQNHAQIHSDERSFICSSCDKGFKQLSQLKNHEVIHLKRKPQRECQVCGRTFSDAKCLHKHMQTVHNKLKPYVCVYCGHSCARKAMLQLHLRQHTGEKPFACDICAYTTCDHNSLRRHKMRHTGLKQYKCPHCPYECIQAISYKSHMKSKHPGMDGLFCCTLCSFRSVNKANYKNHLGDHKRGTAQPNLTKAVAETPIINGDQRNTQVATSIVTDSSSAQLIFSCLNTLSENSPFEIEKDNNQQTITIQIPVEQNVNSESLFLTTQ